VQASAVAQASPQQRFRWLMDALELAAATGALARARARKQADCDRLWTGRAASRAADSDGPDEGSDEGSDTDPLPQPRSGRPEPVVGLWRD